MLAKAGETVGPNVLTFCEYPGGNREKNQFFKINFLFKLVLNPSVRLKVSIYL